MTCTFSCLHKSEILMDDFQNVEDVNACRICNNMWDSIIVVRPLVNTIDEEAVTFWSNP